MVEETGREHGGLARTFVTALAMAPEDERVRRLLADGFGRTRQEVARVLGHDQAGHDAGGLTLALFNGLLFQALVDPGLAIVGERMVRAQGRLRAVMPGES